ncbi:MAG TPA: hypothetical protein PKW66_25265, partial [Polyangiaceae bacterium]|nr:hypothetical protein [Polyangiaceae bacterium]
MKAKAPGKIVISGAYAVLEGAPALVTAVDRYVVADSEREAVFEAPEVRVALPTGPLPYFDASSLRKDGRKLGLGSSAAIVVACLAVVWLERHPILPEGELANRIWLPAMRAHRAAQGGGSGIDVATSAHGGTRRCWLDGSWLRHEVHALPDDLHIDIYAAREPSSTPEMLATVRAWAKRAPQEYRRRMDALCEAAKAATTAESLAAFLDVMAQQRDCLARLGDASGAPIVPQELRTLASQAQRDGVIVYPSGAGGGDIVVC